MRKGGCCTLFVIVLGGFTLSVFLGNLVHDLLISEMASQYSLFHTAVIAFDDVYTVVPTGSLSARIITITMFTGAVWFLLWCVILLISVIRKNKSWEDRLGAIAFYTIALIWVWSMVGTLFLPKRLVVFDLATQQMQLTNYQAFGYIWPNPFPSSKQNIPFDQVQKFEYELLKEEVMGAQHDISQLYAITTQDTLLIGSALIYHGEFGWITDWRSHNDILKDADHQSDKIVQQLTDIVAQSQ